MIYLNFYSNPWSEWSAWSAPSRGSDRGFSSGFGNRNRGFSGGFIDRNQGFSGGFDTRNQGFTSGFGSSNQGFGRPEGLRQRQPGSGECCASNYVFLTADVQEVPAEQSTPARAMEAARLPGGLEGGPVEVGRKHIFQTTIKLLWRLS